MKEKNSNTQQLSNRLKEIILDGTWIANTNFKNQLENLNWKTATTKFQSLNTISILAQHIHYYICGLKNVYENDTLEIRDSFSFDFPPIESQNEWVAFLSKFWEDTENLANLILQIPEEKLHQSFVDKKYGTHQRNINGLIEHCYYHLGQIVLIKKAVLNTY